MILSISPPGHKSFVIQSILVQTPDPKTNLAFKLCLRDGEIQQVEREEGRQISQNIKTTNYGGSERKRSAREEKPPKQTSVLSEHSLNDTGALPVQGGVSMDRICPWFGI